jgi:hypothetical protein
MLWCWLSQRGLDFVGDLAGRYMTGMGLSQMAAMVRLNRLGGALVGGAL